MALSNVDPHNLVAALAAENLSEKQYYFAQYNSKGEAILCKEGEPGYVIMEPAEQGQYVTLAVGAERAKCVLGGSVTVGENLTVNSEGKAVKESGSGLIVGVARETGVAGDVIEVLTCTPVTKA